jgi:hypothetical protein
MCVGLSHAQILTTEFVYWLIIETTEPNQIDLNLTEFNFEPPQNWATSWRLQPLWLRALLTLVDWIRRRGCSPFSFRSPNGPSQRRTNETKRSQATSRNGETDGPRTQRRRDAAAVETSNRRIDEEEKYDGRCTKLWAPIPQCSGSAATRVLVLSCNVQQ